MIGTIVSHYEIVEPLGAGGMGVVYKGHDRRLDRFVALKFLPAQLVADEEVKQRFLNEARAASALDHPGICTIHEIDETEDGQPFIVMALYEGESLKDRIARGPLPLAETVELGLQIGNGLAAAHELGILHRDIKPANLFVTRRGEAKILDFGLAKVTGSTRLTRTGTSMGTLGYMSPEQVRGESVGSTTDLWALGAVLYEMVTGVAAFAGDHEGAVVYAILDSDPPWPSRVVAGVPPGFDSLIRRCLAKRVRDRPSSAAELCRQLEAVRGELSAMDEQPTLAHRQGDQRLPPAAESVVSSETAGRSVAVFDFSNITGDPAADWLSGGIAETLSVDFKKISSLRVVGRRRIQEAQGTLDPAQLGDDELVELGRRLAARWLLWGGFQKMGDAIRLTGQCFDVTAAETVGTVKLDGAMGEIFALQDRVLKAVVEALKLEISESEARQIERPETEDLEAYELCARARELSYNMRPEDFPQAAEYLRRAIELDPDYALAYSSLGQLHCFRFIGTTDPEELAIAIDNLQRAVELDPELGDPYAWLTYAYSRERRYEEAVISGRRAVELESDNPSSHYFLGVALWLQAMDEHTTDGYPEALAHLRQVTRLAPRYQPGYQIQASVHYHCGRYDKAYELLRRAAEIEEQGTFELGRFVGAIGLLGRVAFRLGRLDEAADLLEKAFAVSGSAVHVYTPVCNALARCWQGDLLLSGNHRDDGLRAFKAAREQVLASPRSLGIGWALLRSLVGQATCLHSLGMRREASARCDEAVQLLASKKGFDFSGVWDSGDAQIHFELACHLALTQRTEAALESLERAVSCGWMEFPRLVGELALDSIRQTERFESLLTEVMARTRDGISSGS